MSDILFTIGSRRNLGGRDQGKVDLIVYANSGYVGTLDYLNSDEADELERIHKTHAGLCDRLAEMLAIADGSEPCVGSLYRMKLENARRWLALARPPAPGDVS